MFVDEVLRDFVRIVVVSELQSERFQPGGGFDFDGDLMDFVGTAENFADFDPRSARSLGEMAGRRAYAPFKHESLFFAAEHSDLAIPRACFAHHEQCAPGYSLRSW